MIGKHILKEIILSNEEFILKHVKKIVTREGIYFPEGLNKTIVFYGVRRSGKTFILFDLFKKYRGHSLYIDFEDERLIGFQLKDLERLKETMFELNKENRKREINGLIGACRWLSKDEGMILTYDEEENINFASNFI